MMERMSESKEALPVAESVAGHATTRNTWRSILIWLLCGLIGFQTYNSFGEALKSSSHDHKHAGVSCAQVPALRPEASSRSLVQMEKYFDTDTFRSESSARLSGAVQIPTESFDDLGKVGEDRRWDIMFEFAAYLQVKFPAIHQTLSLEKINTHGLLYTWKGVNETLKPTLLMAHQDVVPVPASTVNQWTHPPFSGFNDGEYIWGRGASDCKNQLMGILEALEALINANYVPQRTIVVPLGFDEEISGFHGAAYLSQHILDRYGKDGIAAVVDEGGDGFTDAWGVTAAIPGVAEKGYIDVHITVRAPGGHSSIPPDHTGIGIMSELIMLIEGDQYETRLADENPLLGFLQCGAEHASHFPKKLKKLLKKRHVSKHEDKLALEMAKLGPSTRYLMQTSIATDLINGGVKVNALPERTTAIVNHRINVGETSHEIEHKVAGIAKGVAKKYNLTLHAFEGKESPRSITLSSTDHTLEPAPITPTDVSVVSPYSILSGTTRALYGKDIIVAPALMTGNTDTKYYWNLTKHIFRFTPGWDGKSYGLGNIHTVDEKVSIKGHVNMVKWMSQFIRNMDAADME